MTEEKYAAAGRPAENKQFCILSAIAMVLVVMGHVDEGLLTIGGLFPYYSFHIALFVFISGYFFRPEDVYRPLSWLKRKALRLLLPYFLWNVLYGMLVMLLRACGFFIGNEPSLWTLFVEPILSGHQFLYNAPAWFVTALFLTEAADLAIRRLFGWAEKGWTGLSRRKRTEYPAEETAHVPREQTEWLFMGLYLCLGFAVAWLSARGSVYDWYRVPGRIMYMLPCYQMGRLYRVSLEKRDTLPDGLYFGILLCVQLAVARFCRGTAVSVAWCNGFQNGPVIPYLTAAAGIAFWLRVSARLTPVLGETGFWRYLGRNTFAVMMHQLTALLAVKGVFAFLNAFLGLCADFDWEAFRTDVYYAYLPNGLPQFRMLYVIAGIVLPLLLQKGLERGRFRLKQKFRTESASLGESA